MQNELLTSHAQVLALVGKVMRLDYGLLGNVGIVERVHPLTSPMSRLVKVDLRRADGSLSSGFTIVGGFHPVYATTWEE